MKWKWQYADFSEIQIMRWKTFLFCISHTLIYSAESTHTHTFLTVFRATQKCQNIFIFHMCIKMKWIGHCCCCCWLSDIIVILCLDILHDLSPLMLNKNIKNKLLWEEERGWKKILIKKFMIFFWLIGKNSKNIQKFQNSQKLSKNS